MPKFFGEASINGFFGALEAWDLVAKGAGATFLAGCVIELVSKFLLFSIRHFNEQSTENSLYSITRILSLCSKK